MQFRSTLSDVRRRLTLRLAIILAVVFGLMAPFVVLIPYYQASLESIARERNAADHKRLADILAVILTEPLWQITSEIATVSSEVVYSDPRVAEIKVFTLPDRKLFINLNSRRKSQEGPFKVETRQIKHGEQIIGEVELTLADDILNENLNAEFRRYANSALVSLIVAVIFILLVLQLATRRARENTAERIRSTRPWATSKAHRIKPNG